MGFPVVETQQSLYVKSPWQIRYEKRCARKFWSRGADGGPPPKEAGERGGLSLKMILVK